MMDCTSSPQAVIVELMDLMSFLELTDFAKLIELMKTCELTEKMELAEKFKLRKDRTQGIGLNSWTRRFLLPS